MTGQWLMWAQRQDEPVDGREFLHIEQDRRTTQCYGQGNIVPVRVAEDPDGGYWGWVDADDDGVPTLIQPHHGMYTMQFTYGPEAEEERGGGRTTRLTVYGLDGIDLGYVSNCPADDHCAVCGGGFNLLADVATFRSPVGVLCLTRCADCAEDGQVPDITGPEDLIDRCNAHAVHLGLNVDEVAALMEMEDDER